MRTVNEIKKELKSLDPMVVCVNVFIALAEELDKALLAEQFDVDPTAIWMYEWDTDFGGDFTSYDDTFENATRCNVGYFITDIESTIFVGLKPCLVKFLELELGEDADWIFDEITQFHYIDTSRSTD